MVEKLLVVCAVLLYVACAVLGGWVWGAKACLAFNAAGFAAVLGALLVRRWLRQARTHTTLFSAWSSCLASHSRARWGQRAKPWFLLVGPQGAGKSSLMGSLQPTAESQHGEAQHGVLWSGPQAVCIETPGRFWHESPDADWAPWLQCLRRHRGRRGIAAIMVVIDVKALAAPGAAAAILRDRLRDIAAALDARLPVYLWFTQCDQLDGFKQTFGACTHAAREQPWGFALPENQSAAQHGASEFAHLLQALRVHTLLQLDASTPTADREPLFLFPHFFALLEKGLTGFLQQVFAAPQTRGAGCWARGVYFCATQTTQAMPQASMSPSGTANLPMLLDGRPPSNAHAPYFVRQTFDAVILRDVQARPASTGRPLRDALARRRAAVVCAAAAVLLLTIQGFAAVRNHGMVQRVSSALTHARDSHHATSMARLEPLRCELQRMFAQRRRQPWTTHLVADHTEQLRPTLAAFYARQFTQTFMTTFLHEDIDELTALWEDYRYSDAPPNAAQLARASMQLKMYLLLTQPRAADEPPLGPAEQTWLRQSVAERWADEHAAELDEGTREHVVAHLDTYLDLLAEHPDLAVARKPDLVAQVRAVLNRAPLATILAAQLQEQANQQAAPVRLRDVVRGAAVPLKNDTHVPGAYTRQAWEEIVLPWLQDARAEQEAWVFARRDASARNLNVAVRSRYYAEYIRAWQGFLDGIRFVPSADAGTALSGLRSLAMGQPSPLENLFATLARHTQLHQARSLGELELPDRLASVRSRLRAAAGTLGAVPLRRAGGAESLDETSVEQAFAPFVAFGVAASDGDASALLPLHAHRDQLLEMSTILQSFLDEPREADSLLQRAQTVRNSARVLIEQASVGTGARPWLQPLLMEPLEQGMRRLSRGARVQAGSAWCSSVVSPYARLQDHYPFARNGADAPLADVAEFFRPRTGALWAFFDAELARDVARTGETFVFEKRLGGAITQTYSPALLTYLKNAQAASRSFFANGEDEAQLVFEMRLQLPRALRSVTLEFDGSTLSVDGAQSSGWTRVRWPGPQRGSGAALTALAHDGLRENLRAQGEWSLFRLLEQGTVVPSGQPGVYTVRWGLASHEADVVAEVRGLRQTDLLVVNGALFGSLRSRSAAPPRAIISDSAPCQ